MQNSPAAPRRENKSRRAFSKHLRARNILSNHGCTDFLTASCHVQCKINTEANQDKLMRNMIEILFFLYPVATTGLWVCYRAKAPVWKQTLVTNLRFKSLGCTVCLQNCFSGRALLCIVVWMSRSSSRVLLLLHQTRPTVRGPKIPELKSFQQVHPNQ